MWHFRSVGGSTALCGVLGVLRAVIFSVCWGCAELCGDCVALAVLGAVFAWSWNGVRLVERGASVREEKCALEAAGWPPVLYTTAHAVVALCGGLVLAVLLGVMLCCWV